MLKVKELKEIIENMDDEDEVVVETDGDEYFDIYEYAVCKRKAIDVKDDERIGRLILTIES